ncbi:hypothetical protein MLD38_016907 [Melastoma candidum]|uniref:Uncharacterized protein n=1 Tax=Melastoma candidum TaxID=119954 RepID=A0ACB9QP37_9MYRT|nr:hypothetical protein MLD38_016907 [Melastoma candidum]
MLATNECAPSDYGGNEGPRLRPCHRTRDLDRPGVVDVAAAPDELEDSLEEDVPLELPDTSRSGLRDRHVGGKKDRERSDRVDRDRERLLRNKRRRGDGNSNNHRLIHHGGTGNRGEELGMVADESSEESVNDNEDEDDYEHLHHQQHTRLLQPASAVTSSASMMLNNSRRSYPPSASAMPAAAGAALKVNRPAWKAADEMIGVQCPEKPGQPRRRGHMTAGVGGGTTVGHASGDQAARQSPRDLLPWPHLQ